MAYLKWLVPLTVLYILLSGNAEFLNWILGLLIAIGVVALLRPARSAIVWRRLPQVTLTALQFLLMLLRDLISSGLQVARLILQPTPVIQQGIIAIADSTDQEWVTTVSAEAITLTPGELVVEIGGDGTLYIHTLDVADSLRRAPQAQARRVQQLEEISS